MAPLQHQAAVFQSKVTFQDGISACAHHIHETTNLPYTETGTVVTAVLSQLKENIVCKTLSGLCKGWDAGCLKQHDVNMM
jgi:hypothetical protein